jgi:hypothetical protein
MAHSSGTGMVPAGLLPDDDELLKRWAPQLYLHPEEKYFPCSVDWYLQRVSLLDGAGREIYKPVIDPPERPDSSVLADEYPGQRREWTLRILQPRSRAGDLQTASCYGYARDVTDPQSGRLLAKDLNFWFFYAFNGNIFNRGRLTTYLNVGTVLAGGSILVLPEAPYLPLALAAALLKARDWVASWDGVDMHQGDWETVTVRVDPSGEIIQKIYFAAHGQGSWETEFDRTQDGRPKVYVAKESHASYATTGQHSRLAGLGNDHTSDQGKQWDTRPVVVDVGYDRDVSLAVLWNGAAGNYFDNGDDPSIAVNTDREVISVHKAGPSDGRLFYNAGTVEIDEQSNQARIRWWKKGGTRFDEAPNASNPAVAINDGGLIVSVHHARSHFATYNLGALNPFDESVTWWNQGTFFGEGIFPTVALNNQNVVVVARLDGQEEWILYNTGLINLTTKAIDWRFGEQSSNRRDPIMPSIALSDRGDLVEVHSYFGTLFLRVGWVDESQHIIWSGPKFAFSTGYSPVIAINRGGFVIVVANAKGQRFYSAGQIAITGDDPPQRSITWLVKDKLYGSGNGGQSVALTSDGIVVEADRIDGRLLWNAGRAIMDAKSGRDDQRWLRYSGRWGRKGDPPFIEFLGVRLANVGDGPEGPAFKDSWIAGPDE